MEQYQQEYEDFMEDCRKASGAVSVQDISIMITKQAQYYARFNNIANALAKPYNRLYAAKLDDKDAIGKLIAVSKAEQQVKATSEYEAYQDALIALKNIDRYIEALKQLQYGTGKEYGHAGNT